MCDIKINFTVENSEGVERKISWTPDELEEHYWECEEDLPEPDELVTYCEFAGKELYFNDFEELVLVFMGCID